MTALSYAIIYIIEAFIYYYYCTNMYEPKKSKHNVIITISLFYVTAYILYIIFNSALINTISFILFSYVMMLILYKSTPFSGLLNTLTLTLAMAGGELLIAPIFNKSFYTDQQKWYNMLILSTLSKLSYFIIVNVIVHLFAGIKFKKLYTRMLNVVIVIESSLYLVIIYSVMYLFLNVDLNIKYRLLIIITAASFLVIAILSAWLYVYIIKNADERLMLTLQFEKEHNYRKYYENLINEDEQHRIIIHDIKNHLQSIKALNDKNETEQIDNYISHLISDYELQSPKKLSDNRLLNAICNRYDKLCEIDGTSFNTDIRKGCLASFPDNELTSIICNLLDNAVEATNEIPNAYIDLNIHNENGYTYISVINTCLSNPISSTTGRPVPNNNTPPNTLHGLGLKSVELIVNRHNGVINYIYDNDLKEFHVMLSLETNSI